MNSESRNSIVYKCLYLRALMMNAPNYFPIFIINANTTGRAAQFKNVWHNVV